MLMSPSDMRTLALDIDLPSPLLLRRLGVPLLRWEYEGASEARDFRTEFLGESAPRGLGGKLLTRPSLRGGCGNELMLTVFRSVRAGVPRADDDLGCGSADVGAGEVGGAKLVDGALSPLLGFGVLGIDLLAGVGMLPVLLRVLAIGSAGRAIVGGPLEGRDGLGSVAAIVAVGLCWGRIGLQVLAVLRADRRVQ